MEFKHIIDNVKETKIQKSTIHGYGLFAQRDFRKGETIGYLDGEIISWNAYDEFKQTLDSLSQKYKNYEIYDEWNVIDDKFVCLRMFRTKYSFINHCRTPNIELKEKPLRLVIVTDCIK